MKQKILIHSSLFGFLIISFFMLYPVVFAGDTCGVNNVNCGQGTITVNVPSGFTGSAQIQVTVSGTGVPDFPITLNLTACANGGIDYPTCTPPSSKPSTPTGLSVTPSVTPSPCGNNWLNISWNASLGATSYQVYRDGGGTAVYDGSGTSFSDTGLILSSSHSYTVRATNAIGSSALSSSLSGVVASACSGVTVTVSATTPYNTTPGATVSFAYTPSTTSGAGTECRLLDNTQTPLTTYQASSPISQTVPNAVGSYAYYVQCRDKTTTTATATSNLITVNTATGGGPTAGISCNPATNPTTGVACQFDATHPVNFTNTSTP